MADHQLQDAVEQLYGYMDSLWEHNRQVDWTARVESVQRNNIGQVTNVSAIVQGHSGIQVSCPSNQTDLYPGATIAVENLGSVGAPVWYMRAGVMAGAAPPGIWTAAEDYSLPVGNIFEGDVLFGSAEDGQPNFFYDESAGEFQGRISAAVMLSLNAIGSAYFGSRTGAHVLITGGNLAIRYGTTGTDKIRLDQAGNATLEGSLTVGMTGNIKGGMTGYAAGSGFFIGYDEGVPKLAIGDETHYFRWDGSTTGMMLAQTVINAPLELEFMKMLFTQVSWSQFAIWDGFSDETKRGTDATPCRVYEDCIDNGTDVTPASSRTFTSKTYSDITTVLTGTSDSVGLNYLQDDDGAWFTNQYLNYTLVDSALAEFAITGCTVTPRRIVISGTPAAGAYSIRSALPGYAICWTTYEQNGGEVKVEASFDNAANWQTFVDTATSTDLSGGTVVVANPGTDYSFKITLTNSGTGVSPKFRNILVCTDPSVWQG